MSFYLFMYEFDYKHEAYSSDDITVQTLFLTNDFDDCLKNGMDHIETYFDGEEESFVIPSFDEIRESLEEKGVWTFGNRRWSIRVVDYIRWNPLDNFSPSSISMMGFLHTNKFPKQKLIFVFKMHM